MTENAVVPKPGVVPQVFLAEGDRGTPEARCV